VDSYQKNLFLRRSRLIVGGSLFGSFDYFFDTDFANLLKSTDTFTNTTNMMTGVTTTAVTTTRGVPGMNVQDIFGTWKPFAGDKSMVDVLKIDVGYMLPPLAHNAIQSAGTLLAWDYFAYSFQHAASFAGTSTVGRDVGLQARGLLIGGHVEYRVGVFQGAREAAVAPVAGMTTGEVSGRNAPRVAARVQVNLLDPETGFFYSGTYLGAKKILSLGGSYDFEGTYKYFAADAILDYPLGPGIVSAQVNFAKWNLDNNVTLVDLARQQAIMSEAGFTLMPMGVSLIGRFEQRKVPDEAGAPTETRYGGGLAFWPYGHTANVKVFAMHVHPTFAGQRDFNDIVAQLQLFFY
jgi:hypothetical protein